MLAAVPPERCKPGRPGSVSPCWQRTASPPGLQGPQSAARAGTTDEVTTAQSVRSLQARIDYVYEVMRNEVPVKVVKYSY